MQRGSIKDNALMPDGTAKPKVKKTLSQPEIMKQTLIKNKKKGIYSSGVGVGI
jgi:hypothetical protein